MSYNIKNELKIIFPESFVEIGFVPDDSKRKTPTLEEKAPYHVVSCDSV
jgi:hypothetical protein